jgi:hypothetical protein
VNICAAIINLYRRRVDLCVGLVYEKCDTITLQSSVNLLSFCETCCETCRQGNLNSSGCDRGFCIFAFIFLWTYLCLESFQWTESISSCKVSCCESCSAKLFLQTYSHASYRKFLYSQSAHYRDVAIDCSALVSQSIKKLSKICTDYVLIVFCVSFFKFKWLTHIPPVSLFW